MDEGDDRPEIVLEVSKERPYQAISVLKMLEIPYSLGLV